MGTRTTISSRATVILLISILVSTTLALTPATATSGGDGDDLETVRAEVAGTFTYKIGLLTDKRSQTDNPERIAIYTAGITELTSVRDTDVASAGTVEALWALDDQAHAIYHATVQAADAVAPSPAEQLAAAKDKANRTIEGKIAKLRTWIEGCEDPAAIAAVNTGIAQLEALYPLVEQATTADDAYAVKQRAHDIYSRTLEAAEAAKGDSDPEPEPQPKEKTEAEKAAEALARARRATLSLIDETTALLRAAAEAEQIPAIVHVFENAAADVDALGDDAKNASSVSALDDIDDKVLTIYEAAKEAAMAIRNSEGGDPAQTVAAYLERVANYVTTTTASAAPTEPDSPDTFADLVAARDAVLDRVDRVADAVASGVDLEERWERLNTSLRDYRLALIRHYIALGEPMSIGGIQIPG